MTALPFVVDTEPPADTRISGVQYGPGARAVNVTMMRHHSSCLSPAAPGDDTYGWRFSLDGNAVALVSANLFLSFSSIIA